MTNRKLRRSHAALVAASGEAPGLQGFNSSLGHVGSVVHVKGADSFGFKELGGDSSWIVVALNRCLVYVPHGVSFVGLRFGLHSEEALEEQTSARETSKNLSLFLLCKPELLLRKESGPDGEARGSRGPGTSGAGGASCSSPGARGPANARALAAAPGPTPPSSCRSGASAASRSFSF